MIRVSSLTKDYGTRRAINNLNFHIKKGEIVGFLGPNGAGKTTTMRILSGYMPPTFGEAEIGGYKIIENSLDIRRIVGYLPETVPLYPDMTIDEYLNYMGNLRHIADKQNRIKEVLSQVSLEERAHGYIGNLSKGLKQRVGLAQAIFHKPEVLILDEPTIGLDPAQIIEFREIIRDIGKEHTVLLSTHILSEAQQVCSRVLIINKGIIVAEDSPESLQSRLTGSQRIQIKIRNMDFAPLQTHLQKIPGVQAVSHTGNDSCLVETLPGEDVRAVIARTLVESRFELLELHTETMSLEEIFLELTRDEQPDLIIATDNGQKSKKERN